MNLILSPFDEDNSSDSVSLLRIMQDLMKYSFGGKIINDLVYNQKFMSIWLNIVNKMFPDLQFYGNSFIQTDALMEFSGEIYVVADDSYISKYHTGNQYLAVYNRLKKEKMRNIHLNVGIESESEVDYNNVLCTILILWRETHMGEITDAITAAIKSIQNGSNESVDKDEVKQAMADIGMPVDGYEKAEQPAEKKAAKPVKRTPIQSEETKKEPKDEGFMNPPEENDSDELPTEICCKINDGRLVLMIPHGARLNSVEVADMKFDTLTVDVPDTDSTKLQLLSIYGQVEDARTQQIDKIVRVPIIFTDEERKQWNAEINTKTDKKPVAHINSEDSAELSELKQQKAELDEKIKEARAAGDDESVKSFRKQRRKLREEINKLEV
jgi:hypothetical protein